MLANLVNSRGAVSLVACETIEHSKLTNSNFKNWARKLTLGLQECVCRVNITCNNYKIVAKVSKKKLKNKL